MKNLFFGFLFVLSLPLFGEVQETYGALFKKEKGVLLSQVIKNFGDKEASKEVIVQGKVGNVCQVKGCWLILESDKVEARVKFEGYKFFVPMTLRGKKILAKGKLHKKLVDVEMLRHLAKDNGVSEKEIKKITTPKVEYQFVASGIRLL